MLPLTKRQSFILNRVVDTFIQTGYPVSSRLVANASPMPVSPATVRNEMGALEDTGYLVQAHHSSGRIPTDRGYRHFLDYGLESAVFDPVSNWQPAQLRLTKDDVKPLAEEAAAKLSGFARELGVLLVPEQAETRLQMTAQGLSYLLEKPECKDASKLRPLVHAVEEKETLTRWIDKHAADASPRVFVGSEHDFDELTDYSIITARYESANGMAGAVAVIGIKRMDYSRVLPAVAGMARWMGKALRDLQPE